MPRIAEDWYSQLMETLSIGEPPLSEVHSKLSNGNFLERSQSLFEFEASNWSLEPPHLPIRICEWSSQCETGEARNVRLVSGPSGKQACSPLEFMSRTRNLKSAPVEYSSSFWSSKFELHFINLNSKHFRLEQLEKVRVKSFQNWANFSSIRRGEEPARG